MADKKTVYLSGKIYWAKILGEPHLNYNKDGKEWTFEFEPDKDGLAILKDHKLTDRLKDKHENRGKYLVLKKSELNREGQQNTLIRVYDKNNVEWNRTTLIGNGSLGDVKLDIRDYGIGKKKGIYPVALRVTELVHYESSEFGAMDNDKPAAVKDTFKQDFGLDDEVLF